MISGSKYPIMVVSSESMEPAFRRGDLILLWNQQEHIRAGDIPVVWFPGRPLPMVHRAIKVSYNIKDRSEPAKYLRLASNRVNRMLIWYRQLILTKGDNNEVDDVSLYPKGRSSVYRQEIVGLVIGYIPHVGKLILALKERSEMLLIAVLFVVAGILL
jgi:signal peptidase